ncbi:MAG: T9SS type A sorting domain-containing protein [Sporocytophaga sp.]|uniref:T9SS type A sorting domain-containing protein n=1 Tax=Sporocytophaga sp. TaxID=2231183 RepID=UPI001AFF2E32|nr:T9SS type A sorting domain-containing protein [Sporocytophaga sp.]MBO9702719.1 T9SS type A sorting domain-containing protein [Sporocytophaga sp.]
MKKTLKITQLVILFSCSFFGIALAQPTLLKSIPSGSINFVSSEGRLFFTSGDSLWTSDGSTSGTYFIKKTGEPFVRLTNFRLGTFIYFTTQQADGKTALWRTNGTGANTTKVAAYAQINPFVVYNNNLYLGIDDGIHGYELWKLNLSNSLSMVKDIVPGSGNGIAYYDIIVSSNILYFTAFAGPGGINIWKTNGTESGTVLAVDLPFTDVYYNGLGLKDVNGSIYFARHYKLEQSISDTGVELWISNGTTAGTNLLYTYEDEYTSYSIGQFTSLNGKLIFLNTWNNEYVTLWTSDGTINGTVEITALFFDDAISPFFQVKDKLAITSINNNNFQNPFIKTDGTEEGTIYFHNFGPYSSLAKPATTGKFLFFNDLIPLPGGDLEDELFQSDLTPENTKSLRSLFGTSFEYSGNITPAGENIYFTTNPYIYPGVRDLKLWSYNPNKPLGNVPYFTLVNANSDTDIAWLKDGDYIFTSETPQINIRYNSISMPGSVVFKLNGGIYRTENQPPYSLAGDTDGDYNIWPLSTGVYELTAIPYSSAGGGGTAGTPLTIHITVKDSSVFSYSARKGEILDNSESTNIEAYPNPSPDYFNFSILSKDNGIAKAEIYKMDGSLIQTILDDNVTEGQSVYFSWNGNAHQQGMYLFKYSCGSQSITRKIVLTR